MSSRLKQLRKLQQFFNLDSRDLLEISNVDRGYGVIQGNGGGGIPTHLLKKIFDPFFTTKAAGKGTGLGLSICESIVSRFGGRIEACNNEYGGATFVVFVPARGEQP